MKHEVLIGTSGYNFGSWKGIFYPEGMPSLEWLSYFATKFKTVEINNSFYVATKLETYQKWYDQTPENFSFVIKGHRIITQYKKLIDVQDSVVEFFDRAKGLRDKLTCVLWQFPANFKFIDEHKDAYLKRFESFLKLLPKDIKQAIELRDESWFVPEFYALIHKYNAALVLSDSPKFPLLPDIEQPFQYIRLHGPRALYASSYSNEDLQKWAEKIVRYKKHGDVYAYFNNDIGGHAVANAKMLERFLHTSS